MRPISPAPPVDPEEWIVRHWGDLDPSFKLEQACAFMGMDANGSLLPRATQPVCSAHLLHAFHSAMTVSPGSDTAEPCRSRIVNGFCFRLNARQDYKECRWLFNNGFKFNMFAYQADCVVVIVLLRLRIVDNCPPIPATDVPPIGSNMEGGPHSYVLVEASTHPPLET